MEEKTARTGFQVVIKRGKSNILLLNANLRSNKALKGRGVGSFYLNASDIGFSNKVHKITLYPSAETNIYAQRSPQSSPR